MQPRQEMFERMPKDGRETQWRNLVENEYPENAILPDKMDEKYSHLQRFMLLRAVRPDRIMQISHTFLLNILGKKYIGDCGIDVSNTLRISRPDTPILLLYQHEASSAEVLFLEAAAKRSAAIAANASGFNPVGAPVEPVVFQLNDVSVMTERCVKRALQKGMAEGGLVLLHTASSAPQIMLNTISFIEEHVSSADPAFRCFMSAEFLEDKLPTSLIQSCHRVVVDSPIFMKEGIVRTFNNFDPEILRKSAARPDWPAALHNLAFLHAAIRLRRRYPLAGWRQPTALEMIGDDEFRDALQLVSSEISDNLSCVCGPEGKTVPRNTSFQCIRYMLSEIIYGNSMSQQSDIQTLSAISDYWLSLNSLRKDFEMSKLKFKIPSPFFASQIRMGQLVYALEQITPFFLDCPEGCHIHPAGDTLLGDDQYVFTRLNKLVDAMSASSTNCARKLFDKPPEPNDGVLTTGRIEDLGPIVSQISMTSQHSQVAPRGVMASSCYLNLKSRKETELWEICYTLFNKTPRPLAREYVLERMKKNGGPTVFNNFIVREIELLSRLVNRIRTSLTDIRNALELNQLGDLLSEEEVDVADDLYFNRVPAVWLKLAGAGAPPVTYPIATWFQELTDRNTHLDRILLLGRDKTPSYCLGAFFNPRALLAIVRQEAYVKQVGKDRSGNLEPVVFQTEVTARDKDHLRDPPQEGVFIYGLYLWNCGWEKTTCELSDVPAKSAQGCTSLPVVHLTCCTADDKTSAVDPVRALETFACPVRHTRLVGDHDTVLELDMHHDGLPASRWALRGVHVTLRPY